MDGAAEGSLALCVRSGAAAAGSVQGGSGEVCGRRPPPTLMGVTVRHGTQRPNSPVSSPAKGGLKPLDDRLQEGNCFECIGEVSGTLNTCDLDSPSCVSSQNDDEAHFVAPWMYDGSAAQAVEELVAVATGRAAGTVVMAVDRSGVGGGFGAPSGSAL